MMTRDQRLELLLSDRTTPQPEPLPLDPRIPFARAARFHGVTPRTLDRWLEREELSHPKPEKIAGRRYFRLSQLLAWDDTRARSDDSEWTA
jgi:hypothetical protein